MTVRRAALLILLSGQLWRTSAEDIYQRVKRALGDDAEAELRAKNFASVEQRLAVLKPTTDSERAETLALSGALEFLEGKMPQAVADFRASQKIQPPKENDRFTFAMALVRLGDDTEARNVLAGLTKEHETTALYWYWLGRVDYDERRYNEAVENLQKAVNLEPKTARGWDSLGLAWDMQGQMQRARDTFEKAVTLNREQPHPSPWPPHNLGYLLLRMGDSAKAEESLRESLRYDPDLARTHYYLARTLEKEGRTDEAILEYKTAVAGDTASADSCYSLAMLYRKLHKEKEAKAMFAEYKRRKGGEDPPKP